MRRLFFSSRKPQICEEGVSESSGNTPLAAQPSSDEAWLSPVSAFGQERGSSSGAEETERSMQKTPEEIDKLSTTASRGRPRRRRQHMSCMQAFACSGRLPRSTSPEERNSSRDARATRREAINFQNKADLTSASAVVPGQATGRFFFLGSWAPKPNSSARRASKPVAESVITGAGPAPGVKDASCGKKKPLDLSGIDLKYPSDEEVRQELERLRMRLEDRPLAQCKVQVSMPEKPLSPQCQLLPPAPVVAAPSPEQLPSPEVLRLNMNPMISRPSLLARNARAASADAVNDRFRLAVDIAETAMTSGGTPISIPSTRTSPGLSVSQASSGDTSTNWSGFSSPPLCRPNPVGLLGRQRFQQAPPGTTRARAATADGLGLRSSGVRIQQAQDLFSEMLAPGSTARRFTCSSEAPALDQQRHRPRTSSGTRNFADARRASAPVLTPLNGSCRSIPTVDLQAGNARPSSAGTVHFSKRSELLPCASTVLHMHLPEGTRNSRSCSVGRARSSQASIPEGQAVVPTASRMGTEDPPTKAATDAAFCQLLAAALAEPQQSESNEGSAPQPDASPVPLSPVNKAKVASPSSRRCLLDDGDAAKDVMKVSQNIGVAESPGNQQSVCLCEPSQELTEGLHIEFPPRIKGAPVSPSSSGSGSPVAARRSRSKHKHKPTLKMTSPPLPLPGCTSCQPSREDGKRSDPASGSTCPVQADGSKLLGPPPDLGASFNSNSSLDTADEEREREASRTSSPRALKSPKRSRYRRDLGEVMAMRRRLEEACGMTRMDRE
eukprot:TRINITY_DN2863_c0_g1_i1.p1 TRINITY_DN2863_c0_g1~~TRINITY_DN2863_c0_g1_i1.p1  ORF type:complete len:782 (+),score=119.02 TRINITY_DN2863_c0_g1_i1:167-2512(+)